MEECVVFPSGTSAFSYAHALLLSIVERTEIHQAFTLVCVWHNACPNVNYDSIALMPLPCVCKPLDTELHLHAKEPTCLLFGVRLESSSSGLSEGKRRHKS